MANIFGAIGLADSDLAFSGVVGQEIIFAAANEYVAKRNAELQNLLGVFIEKTTDKFKFRWKNANNGMLGTINSQGTYGTSKASGEWDVAFPIYDYGREIAGSKVAMAYMTAEELTLHIQGIVNQNVNTMRFQILKALLNSAQDSFSDEIHGTLLVEPLANGDTVLYPPVAGTSTEATDDHYLEAGYLATAISDTNNPFKTLVAELDEHTGEVTGGESIITFIHRDEVPETEALTDFIPVEETFIASGANADIPVNLPFAPGKLIGRCNGTWISQWSWVPTGYMLATNLNETPPLVKRVDPANTNLPGELTLVSEDERYPIESMTWSHRFGLGAGNRLNGAVMELAAGGTYTVPTAYA